MTRLSMDFSFCAAHRLPQSEGMCRRVHGHNYKLRVTLEGEPDPASGMIIDFYELQGVVEKEVLSKVDHHDLNEILQKPTAELIAAWMWEQLEPVLPNLFELRLYEVDECFVSYRGSKRSVSP